MSPDLSPEAWAQIRTDYEHTERPIEDLCAAHGISSGTLRDRVRRWRWARRRLPIPPEGPPAAPRPFADTAAMARAADRSPDGAERNPGGLAEPLSPPGSAPLHPGTVDPPPALRAGDGAAAPGAPDERPIAVRLQSAVDRVLPAIEATVARLGAQGMHPREMERAARALGVLTRSLRELNGLLSERRDDDRSRDDDMPEDMDAYRRELARRIDAFVASRTGAGGQDPPPSKGLVISD